MSNSLNIFQEVDLSGIEGAGFDTLTDSLVMLRDELSAIEGGTWNPATDSLDNLFYYVTNVLDDTTLLNFTGSELDVNVQNKGVLNDVSEAQVNAQAYSALNMAIPATPNIDSINDLISRLQGIIALQTATYDLSDTVIHSNDRTGDTILFAYAKEKEIICPITDTIRIKFDIKTELAGQMAYGKIYKNGGAVGTERTSVLETYTTFSEDLAFTTDDTIELWCRVANTSWKCYYENFRVTGNIHKYFINTLE